MAIMFSRWPASTRRAAALLVGLCALATLLSFDEIPSSFDEAPSGRRILDAAGGAAEEPSLPGELLPAQAPQDHADGATSRKLFASSRGTGPEFAGMDGQFYKLGDVPRKGVTWYKMLASPRMQWNAAPYAWTSCRRGHNATLYLGSSGFAFHEPDPKDPTRMKSKHLRFRVERQDQRECLWNFSKACLAGGSFVMNFGKTARDMLYPGDYSLKTSDGAIRIVAHNTVWACTLAEDPQVAYAPQELIGQPPIEYLRRSLPSTMDPEACQAWIEKNESEEELFLLNSDMATVHVDAPWMTVVMQVRLNKVATEKECVFAGMDVWMANASPELVEGGFSGVLEGDNAAPARAGRALRRNGARSSGMVDGKAHVVDGPFGA